MNTYLVYDDETGLEVELEARSIAEVQEIYIEQAEQMGWVSGNLAIKAVKWGVDDE